MIIWLDAQLPASAAAWITATFGIKTHAVRDLGLRDAKDGPIFQAARAADAVVMTKDGDFVEMLQRLGPPPKVIVDPENWTTSEATLVAQEKGDRWQANASTPRQPFKAHVALAALKTDRTINELASQYGAQGRLMLLTIEADYS